MVMQRELILCRKCVISTFISFPFVNTYFNEKAHKEGRHPPDLFCTQNDFTSSCGKVLPTDKFREVMLIHL